MPQTLFPEFFDSDIDASEVMTAIIKRKSNKSPGIDGIPIECWKKSPQCIDILVELFNKFLQSGFYPDQWKTAVVVPVTKKVTLGKVYAGILNARFLKWNSSYFSLMFRID